MSKWIDKEISVEVSLAEWSDEELVDEMNRRGYRCSHAEGRPKNAAEFATRIYEAKSRGDTSKADELICEFIYEFSGRIV